MNELLPRNALPQERAMALAVARFSDLPVPLRLLWDPLSCPLHVLPWLAWALSVEAWNPDWPEHLKRGVVKGAIDTARRKGTKGAVLDALAALGAHAELIEWFEMEPPGPPHTFRIDIVGNTTSAEMQDMMIAEVWRTKPLRSHFTVNFGAEFEGSVNAVGVLRVSFITRLDATAESFITLSDYLDPGGDPYVDPLRNPYQHYL